MKKIIFDSEYFNVKDTLECGQVFRFRQSGNGYIVISKDRSAFVTDEGDKTVILIEDGDYEYFYHYFDLERDYSKIVESARAENVEILLRAAESGKGIRILNQDLTEMLFSFIISQNNNIPRIKGIIEKLSKAKGERKEFMGESFYAFPSAEKLACEDINFFREIGLGYRAEYIKGLAELITNGFDAEKYRGYSTDDLRKELLKVKGIGPKVADCVILFGYHKSDSFPVDTWIEKVYKTDFNGKITDRAKIAEYFVERFKENSGYYQQYLFYEKRKNGKSNLRDKK